MEGRIQVATLTADGVVLTGKGTYFGHRIIGDGTNAASTIIYDNTAASGTVIDAGRSPGANAFGDMFTAGIPIYTGIYVDLTVGAGSVRIMVWYTKGT